MIVAGMMLYKGIKILSLKEIKKDFNFLNGVQMLLPIWKLFHLDLVLCIRYNNFIFNPLDYWHYVHIN